MLMLVVTWFKAKRWEAPSILGSSKLKHVATGRKSRADVALAINEEEFSLSPFYSINLYRIFVFGSSGLENVGFELSTLHVLLVFCFQKIENICV